MNRIRLFKGVILILVLLNLGTLTFVWFQPRRPAEGPLRGDPARFLVQALDLTREQQEQFGRMRAIHHLRLITLQQHDRRLHDRFFGLIFNPGTDSLASFAYADSISAIRKQMELLTYEHFMKLRQILTEEQKVKFHKIFREVLDHVMSTARPPAPGMEDAPPGSPPAPPQGPPPTDR
ncbi:MAG: periplasmic heavy metal sensor [Bacteroidota bacterium]